MMSPFTSEKKQLVSFCSPSGEELRKFAEELREAIAEVNEMEQIHIQCKTEVHKPPLPNPQPSVPVNDRLKPLFPVL